MHLSAVSVANFIYVLTLHMIIVNWVFVPLFEDDT